MTLETWLNNVQALCLAYPEATQEYTFESETFRVRKKIFAMHSVDDLNGAALWVKGRPGDQEMMIAADASRFFKPPYLGPKGWIGIRLTKETDWDELADLIETSYRLIAPKRLSGLLDVNP